MEIVGVSLGVASLALASIEYKRHVVTGKEMKQLERSFKTEHSIFLNTVEMIFAPLVPEGQLGKLLRNPDAAAWQDAQLSAKLKQHLGPSYEVFEELMEDIKVIMVELQTALGPKDLESRKVSKRVKEFVLRPRSKEGLVRLKSHIAELETIREQRHRVAKLYTTRGPKNLRMETYTRVRKCALSLHSALSRGWHCGCETPHLANLRLEARKAPQPETGRRGRGEADVRFKFMFSFTGEENVSGQASGFRGTSRESPLDWREAELAPLDPIFTDITPELGQDGSKVIPLRPSQLPSSSTPTAAGRSQAVPHEFVRRERQPAANGRGEGQGQGQETVTTEHLEIKDLCQYLKTVRTNRPNEDDMLGYLSDADGIRYGLYSVNSGHDVEPPIVSFHIGTTLAPSTPQSQNEAWRKRKYFSQSVKHQLAFTLASTMLQLHSTPWLEKWVKQDIVYLPESGHDTHQSPVRPYISRRISTGRRHQGATPPSPSHIRLQDFVRNETLFTLGVVLIEIAYNRPIEELAEPGDLAGSPAIAPYLTAMRLHKQIQGEMGTRYQRAVEGCLHCDFGVVSVGVDLKDAEVQHKFLEHVVGPLEESLEFFSPVSHPVSS